LRAAGDKAAAILTSPSGIKQRYTERLQFSKETDKCTNNIVEYEAILLGLRKLRAMGFRGASFAQTPKWLLNK
jgi:ribonuclease HI